MPQYRPETTRTKLAIFIFVMCLVACGDDDPTEKPADTGTGVDVSDTSSSGDMGNADGVDGAEVDLPDPWTEIAIEATEGYRARQQEYLEFCDENNGPGQGGIYGQVCRIAMDRDTFNEETIDAACQKVDDRLDTADFRVAGLVRMLYLDREHEALSAETVQQIEESLLGFRYWLTEPGDDKMCFWTENHQSLFHSGELLAGQLFPEETFSNSGMMGLEHVAHAEPLVERWLDFRGQFGFSEWHSNVYFNEDLPALVNLADFAESEVIRTKAAMVLDIMAFDMLNNYYKGYFATTHGRTYDNKFLDHLSDSTTEAAWILVGLGEYRGADNFGGTFLATSPNYVPPPLLETLSEETLDNHEHRQRDSIDVADGPEYGIGYESTEDVVFWSGMAAIAAPEVIDGLKIMLDEYDLWDGFLFGDIPDPYDSMFRDVAELGTLRELAEDMELVARGIALETINTYTYRTPHYQLSGGQDYKPGYWSAQTQSWLATLDGDAYVFTSFPGNFEDAEFGLDFGGAWIGGWLPRATFHRNVGILQYRVGGEVPLLGEYVTADHLHAYFPKERFDDVREIDNWVIGQKGDGFVALYSENPVYWSDENDYELKSDTQANTWIVELGSTDEWASFDEFVDAITGASVSVGDTISYDSPSLGLVEVGWEGAFIVDGEEVDVGPYPRWDNQYAFQEFGTLLTTIEREDLRLELDFEAGTRRYLVPPE